MAVQRRVSIDLNGGHLTAPSARLADLDGTVLRKGIL